MCVFQKTSRRIRFGAYILYIQSKLVLSKEEDSTSQMDSTVHDSEDFPHSAKDHSDIRKLYPSHDPSQCGIVWSENPEIPKWQVKLMLHSSEPEKVEERFGFVVLSTTERNFDDGTTKKIVKLNSQHHSDSIDTEMFRKFMKKGLPFTKLELAGPFLNNVSICPSKYSTSSEVPLLEVVNLKYLILKPKITLAIKGDEGSAQNTYFRIHKAFFDSMKSRTAKNMWFIMKTIYGPKLQTLQIQDFVDWEDTSMESPETLFRYWDQPLGEFLQRHSSSLKSVKASPIPVSSDCDLTSTFSDIPALSELYFCPKLSTHTVSPLPIPKNFETWIRLEHVGNQLHLWKEILGAQKGLNNIGWICDTWNPFPLNRKDFVRLCEDNLRAETLMLIVHGDENFRKQLGAQEKLPPINLKDFQINCTIFHGIASMKILTVGTCSNDPQSRNFCLYNLNLLPRSLEAIHFSGIRIPANELLTLCRLPKLKTLSIIEGSIGTASIGHEHDGVTEAVLKAFIHIRSLEQLVIMGIPVVINEADESETKVDDAEPSSGGIFSFFGGMCGCLDGSQGEASNFLREAIPNEVEVKYRSFLQSLREVGKVSHCRIGDDSDNITVTTSFTVGRSAETPLNLFHRT